MRENVDAARRFQREAIRIAMEVLGHEVFEFKSRASRACTWIAELWPWSQAAAVLIQPVGTELLNANVKLIDPGLGVA